MRQLSGDHHDEMTHEEEHLLILKIVVMVIVLFLGLVIFLPYMKCINDRKEAVSVGDDGDYDNGDFICCGSGRIQSFCLSFAAGMLMTLAICHILPATAESYAIVWAKREAEHAAEHAAEEAAEDTTGKGLRILAGAHTDGAHAHGGGKLPAAYLLFLCGYWLMLLLDQVIFKQVDSENGDHSHGPIEAPKIDSSKVNQIKGSQNGQMVLENIEEGASNNAEDQNT